MADSVVQLLIDSAIRELINFLDSKRQLDELSRRIEGLKTEQQRIQSCLRDADARRYKDKAIQSCLGEMRSLSYRIQDLLETYDMEVQQREGESIKKVLRSIVRMLEDPFAIRNLETEITNIEQRIQDVIELYRLSKASLEELPSLRQIPTSTDVPANDFVGMEKDIDGLVSVMVGEDRNRPFISICGMSGTGKTALARKLYHHPDARRYFEGFAWVDLGKTVKQKIILQNILKQLLPQQPKEEIMETEDIEFTQLQQIQQERKCLIVLDGIESLDAWEVVRFAFSSGEKTSKILMTSRMKEIAETVAGNGYIHTMRCLTEEEGWELLKRKASARSALDDLEDHEMMEEVGKVVKRCKGLPLAIDLLADFMATKHTVEEWKKLYHNMDSFLVAGESQLLASSFNGLPNHLKPCFLYLSYFPEEYNIEVEKLYLFWMAEDMIASEDRVGGTEVNRMEIAEDYLRELQLRSLVDVEEEEVPTFRRFKSCRLHGLMRELCLLKGKEEEFVKVIDFHRGSQEETDSFSFSSGGPIRRLIIYLGKNTQRFPKSFIRETAKYLRCLLIYMDENLQVSVFPKDLSNLSHFTVLRVLDFNGVDFNNTQLPRGISKLKRLRYLSFKGCLLEALPRDIGSLPYLQVLDLRVRSKIIIPNILWKIKWLRHLYLPLTFQTPSHGKLLLGSLRELETLKHLNTSLCNVEDLLKLTNLRHLASITEGSVEELEWLVKRMTMATDHVLYCSIDVRDFDCYTEERHSIVRQLLGCRALHSFSIKGYLGEIPSYHIISQRLTEIVFSGSELKEHTMLAFEKLPNLRVLVLDEDAFIGAEMFCSAAGFYELRRFELSNLRELEKLTIADEAFPKLSAFAIRNCAALKVMEMPTRLEEMLGRTGGE